MYLPVIMLLLCGTPFLAYKRILIVNLCINSVTQLVLNYICSLSQLAYSTHNYIHIVNINM